MLVVVVFPDVRCLSKVWILAGWGYHSVLEMPGLYAFYTLLQLNLKIMAHPLHSHIVLEGRWLDLCLIDLLKEQVISAHEWGLTLVVFLLVAIMGWKKDLASLLHDPLQLETQLFSSLHKSALPNWAWGSYLGFQGQRLFILQYDNAAWLEDLKRFNSSIWKWTSRLIGIASICAIHFVEIVGPSQSARLLS